MQEQELLKKAKNGDELAMEQLFDNYKPLVTLISRKYFLQGGEVSDLVQEGMIGLYRAINSYNSDKNIPFKLYARTCIERKIINAVRQGSSSKNAPFNETAIALDLQGNKAQDEEDNDIGFTLISLDETPETRIISKEKTAEIMSEIKKTLSKFELEVLKLYLDGYSYIDISDKMEKTPKSIDNALNRIKNKLSFLKNKEEE